MIACRNITEWFHQSRHFQPYNKLKQKSWFCIWNAWCRLIVKSFSLNVKQEKPSLLLSVSRWVASVCTHRRYWGTAKTYSCWTSFWQQIFGDAISYRISKVSDWSPLFLHRIRLGNASPHSSPSQLQAFVLDAWITLLFSFSSRRLQRNFAADSGLVKVDFLAVKENLFGHKWPPLFHFCWSLLQCWDLTHVRKSSALEIELLELKEAMAARSNTVSLCAWVWFVPLCCWPSHDELYTLSTGMKQLFNYSSSSYSVLYSCKTQCKKK